MENESVLMESENVEEMDELDIRSRKGHLGTISTFLFHKKVGTCFFWIGCILFIFMLFLSQGNIRLRIITHDHYWMFIFFNLIFCIIFVLLCYFTYMKEKTNYVFNGMIIFLIVYISWIFTTFGPVLSLEWTGILMIFLIFISIWLICIFLSQGYSICIIILLIYFIGYIIYLTYYTYRNITLNILK